MPKKFVLYAGDSGPNGTAAYLLSVLKSLRISTVHVPPSEKISPAAIRKKIDAFIFSDLPHKHLARKAETKIIDQVRQGAGLWMIGGWASFASPFGGWRGSLIEKMLPVTCLARDDRKNTPDGVLMRLGERHPILAHFNMGRSPVLCGFNEVRLKTNAQVILTAQEIRLPKVSAPESVKIQVRSKKYPLLVVDRNPRHRIAVLTTDITPHWCGGLVDWGNRRQKLRFNASVGVEVGDKYVRFLSNILKWLVKAHS